MTQQIASAELRTSQRGETQRVIVDRKWVRTARKHRYETLIVGGGGIIYCTLIDTTDKAEAFKSFDEIVKDWGKEVAAS